MFQLVFMSCFCMRAGISEWPWFLFQNINCDRAALRCNNNTTHLPKRYSRPTYFSPCFMARLMAIWNIYYVASGPTTDMLLNSSHTFFVFMHHLKQTKPACHPFIHNEWKWFLLLSVTYISFYLSLDTRCEDKNSGMQEFVKTIVSGNTTQSHVFEISLCNSSGHILYFMTVFEELYWQTWYSKQYFAWQISYLCNQSGSVICMLSHNGIVPLCFVCWATLLPVTD